MPSTIFTYRVVSFKMILNEENEYLARDMSQRNRNGSNGFRNHSHNGRNVFRNNFQNGQNGHQRPNSHSNGGNRSISLGHKFFTI